MNNYKHKKHFTDIAPEGATIERLSHNAAKYITEEEIGCIYMNTIIYKKNRKSGETILNSNGRQTQTTKKRINYFIGNKLIQKKTYDILKTRNFLTI